MEEFDKLVNLMATLRSEEGCSWDRQQTVVAFKTFLLEEVYEVIDAIEKKDATMLQEELGDILFHIIFIAQICKDNEQFTIKDVINGVYKKMYNRHPHVFQKEAASPIPIELRWEELKKEEKNNYSLLSGIPTSMPALLRAYTISRRAAKVGFDWDNSNDIFDKMVEEIEELKEAQRMDDQESIKEEIGDILFTMVNLSRFLRVDPEDALRFTIDKFIRRFSHVETNTDIQKASLETMDKLWNEAKRMEVKGE